MSEVAKLRFIHLSDIHFSSRASFGFDPDRELRRILESDIAAMRDKRGKANAILISGDIAFSGKREEFEDSAKWLNDVCLAAGCESEDVFMCPGNHDVDQEVIKNNLFIQDGHDAIRRGTNFIERDKALNVRLNLPEARSLFYSPIAAYNEFAARYQSSFFADDETFVWEHDFELNDGSKLRLRGLNTALLSGLGDKEKHLFLGSRAWTLPQYEGLEYMIMAHHPTSWLADGREADQAFDRNSRIQLFGHEHDQRVMPGRDWVKLFAGSINPHRGEAGWKPGYNIIEVYIEHDGSSRLLKVDVHAREWQGSPPQFRSIEDVNHDPVFRSSISLSSLPKVKEISPRISIDGHIEVPDNPSITGVSLMNPPQRFRQAVYRFFRLSLSKKNEIIGHLRLSEESDSRLTDVERFKHSLVRARERNQMDELEELIDKLENK